MKYTALKGLEYIIIICIFCKTAKNHLKKKTSNGVGYLLRVADTVQCLAVLFSLLLKVSRITIFSCTAVFHFDLYGIDFEEIY